MGTIDRAVRSISTAIFWGVTVSTICAIAWCVNEDKTESRSNYQPPPSVEAQHRAEWNVHFAKVSDADRDQAREAVRALVHSCASNDPHGDTWDGVRNVTVEKIDVLGDGSSWTISVAFADSWRFSVLHGDTLWYRVSLDRRRMFPMKRVSGEVCGRPAETWSSL